MPYHGNNPYVVIFHVQRIREIYEKTGQLPPDRLIKYYQRYVIHAPPSEMKTIVLPHLKASLDFIASVKN